MLSNKFMNQMVNVRWFDVGPDGGGHMPISEQATLTGQNNYGIEFVVRGRKHTIFVPWVNVASIRTLPPEPGVVHQQPSSN